MSRWAAILAGGSGTRFWPLSTPAIPKQMLPLAGDRELLVQSVERLAGLISVDRVLVITSAGLVEATRRLLPHLPSANVLGEPRAASTGPALAWATAEASRADANAFVLALHSDGHVGDDAAFRAAAARALDVAEAHDVLVTVGIPPTRPEVGYGYIEPGEQLDGNARRVRRFIEKPDRALAERLITGGALWNCGLFAWSASRFLAEATAVAPEIGPHVAHLVRGDADGFYRAVTPIAVDHSHFERSGRVAVVPGEFPWDDVGTWSALRRIRPLDRMGNVTVGRVIASEASDCVVWANEGPMVVDGVSDLVVVQANGVTLVTTNERAAHLKDLLESLPSELRQVGE